MELIDEINDFYKDCILLNIVNTFYKYITYCLCVIYLIWILINIIINNNLKEIIHDNYSNSYLIFYSFYKMFSAIKLKSNYKIDIIITFIMLFLIFNDIIAKYNLSYINFLIFYSQLFSIFIFVQGIFYMIVLSDFSYNNKNEFITEIYSEIV
jgi:hypothetical protein